MNNIKLFCFPYAGGSAVIYNKWKHQLARNIELRAIELAGRGRRINEPLYGDMDELVTDVFQQIKAEINDAPYAFFGHSLGALICYELVERIKANRFPEPEHIFFSGKTVPHVKSVSKKNYHLLDPEEFKEAVISLGGTPPEFFDYPELAELFLPLLRNDFRIADTYEFDGDVCRYDRNITAFFGKDEGGTPEQYHGWKDYTSELCSIVYFNGGHFFLHEEMENIAHFINQTLAVKATSLRVKRVYLKGPNSPFV